MFSIFHSLDTEMNSTGRPWTFRVENIPPNTTAENLWKRFCTEDQPYIQVRSFVPAVDNDQKDIQEYTATILFQNPDPTVSSPRPLDDDDIAIDSDFHGFTPLTNPTEPIAADIIAVTGLAAHAFGSWAHSARKMWLRDYLPRDIKNARVMVYGYPSQLQGNLSRSILADYSTNLIHRLSTMRESAKCQDRPIVFIGHSLGCLIIKKVLCDINGSVGIYSFRLPVRSIIFLGAPHKGLEIRALETLVKTQPSEDIIRELKAESPTLTELNDKFRFVARNIDILTCYEMTPTKTAIQMEDGSWKKEGPPEMMVSLDSARQWYPREKLVACNADHSQIAKLKRGESGIYPSVKFAIKQAILSAGDLYNEAKSKQHDIMEPIASYDTHSSEPKLPSSYLAESNPVESLILPVSDQSQEVIETSQRSFTLNTKQNVYGEQEASRQSSPLDTAVLGWQRDVEEHNKANRRPSPSFADQTETGTESDTKEKHFSRSQSQYSGTSFGLGIEEPSMSSIPETLSSGHGEAKSRKEQLPPEELIGESVNHSGQRVPVSQGESEHLDVSKNDASAESPSGQEQSNDKSKISADRVISAEDDELTKAIKEGSEEKTRKLLNHNYVIDRRSKCDHGATPLITATKYKQPKLVRFLLEQGASTTARDNDGNTTLHLLTSATDSSHDIIEGQVNENIVELLLESQPPLEITNNDGRTPLMQAVRFGQKYLVERLILSGANVAASDRDGWTALHFAAEWSRFPELISILAEAGAPVNAETTKSPRGTPLHLAASSSQNSAEVIERLIAAGADKEALDIDTATPLHIATYKNNCACVAQLLKLGANVGAAAIGGFTPLHLAAQFCKSATDIIEHLLEAGADIEAKNEHLYSPLDVAVANNNIICVIHLLEHGANIQARNKYYCTPLHTAARYGLYPIVKLLLERGANPCAKDVSTFGGRPSGMVGADNGHQLDSSTYREIKDTLKKAERAWKASGKK